MENCGLKFLLIFIVAVFAVFSFVFAYTPYYTHPDLTEEIAKLFNFKNENQDLEISQKEIDWMRDGAINEDKPPRWINHFYDPIHQTGWSGKHFGTLTQEEGQYEGASMAPRPVLASIEWVTNQEYQAAYSRQYGNQTWQKAIKSYIDNDKKSAFIALGHILHLIEDASVPDHTRDDTHADLYGDPGSPYEGYSKEYTNFNKLNVAENLKNKDLLNFSTIQGAFYHLANYSNNNFFSEDTINNEDFANPNLKTLKKKNGYLYDEIKKIYLAKYIQDGHKIFYTLNNKDFVLSSYFSNLSREAVLTGTSVLNLFFQEVEKYKQNPESLPQIIDSQNTILGYVKISPRLVGVNIADACDKAGTDFQIYAAKLNLQAGNPCDKIASDFKNLASAVTSVGAKISSFKNYLTSSIGSIANFNLTPDFQQSPALSLQSQPQSQNSVSVPQPQPNQPPVEVVNPKPTPPSEPPSNPPPTPSRPQPIPAPIRPPQPPAQNNKQNNQNNAVPWPGFVFASPPPQEEVNNQQEAANNEPAPEQEPEPQDITPPAKPQITSHQNNQYLNKTADEVPDDCSELLVVNCELLVFSEDVQITLKGTADPDSEVLIIQTDLEAELPNEINPDAEGNFEHQITLQEGEKQLEIKARDQAGNESESETITLILDLTPPETIDDLKANAGQNRGEINLTFTKPGDDSGIKEYEIRYSQKQIVETLTEPAEGEDADENEILFSDAEFSQIVNPSGQDQESAAVSNLNPAKKYYFAVKSKDLAENISEISNVAQTNPSAKAEHLVISEFKIEGGNLFGRDADDEFIELYNPTGQDVSLDGWSIQYLGSTAKKFENIEKKNFESEHKIPSHGFFLIAKNNGYRGLTPPDMSHSSFSLSGYGGTIFLVASKEKLETSNDLSIMDKVGYLRIPHSQQYEIYPETNRLIITSPHQSSAAFERKYLKNSTAASLRDVNQDAFFGNAYDTDDNAEDFVLQHPTNPQNSAALPEPKDETWNIKLADSPWPTAFYDQKGSRKTKNLGFLQNPKILWQAALGDGYLQTPAISADDILYFLSQSSLFLLNSSDGQIIKQTKITNNDKTFGPKDYISFYPVSAPIIDNFGTAYFSFKSSSNSPTGLGAANNEGKIRFLKENDGEYSSSPPLIGQETIYQAPNSHQEVFRSFYSDGSKKWSFKARDGYGYYNSDPRMDEDENLYLRSFIWGGVNDGKLSIIDKNGNLLKQSPMNGRLHATKCTLLGDDYYFECGFEGLFYYGVLNIYGKNGGLLFSERSPADLTSAVTQIKENEIIILSNYASGPQPPYRGRLYSYLILPNPEGVPKDADRYGIASNEIKLQFNWYFEILENKTITIPIVDGQGVMYFADAGGKVYAVDPSKGEIDSKTKKLSDSAILWTLDLGLFKDESGDKNKDDKIWHANNLILDDKGVLYAVTEKGKVFAISEDLTIPPPVPEE